MNQNSHVRNLEELYEAPERPTSRLGGLFLAALGGACLVFAAATLLHKPAVSLSPKRPSSLDTLLLPLAGSVAPAPREAVGSKDITFPGILSDDPHPTTALATLQAGQQPSAAPPPASPPPPTDRLTVVPLPAQRALEPSPALTTQPRDPLTSLVREAAPVKTSALAEPGHAGSYVLQVSSFRTEAQATAFATTLRERNHHAYVESAQIAGRGTWYRVRIGPFRANREAQQYRTEVEQKEHIVPFIVDTEKEKRVPESRESERHVKITNRLESLVF